MLAGTRTALAAACGPANVAGATAFDVFDVTVASHGPIQGATAPTLRSHLAALPRRTPTAHYVPNAGGRSAGTATAVLEDLASSVALPVRWYDGARLMTELGVSCTVEKSPLHTLTPMSAAIPPQVTALAFDDGQQAIAARVGRCRR